jgi:hypothetical protein
MLLDISQKILNDFCYFMQIQPTQHEPIVRCFTRRYFENLVGN